MVADMAEFGDGGNFRTHITDTMRIVIMLAITSKSEVKTDDMRLSSIPSLYTIRIYNTGHIPYARERENAPR